MKINYIRAIFSLIPILICGVLLSILYVNKVKGVLIWGVVVVTMAVFIFVLISSFMSTGKFQTEEEANKYKGKILYNNEAFTIVTYSKDFVVNWNTIEAIFFINTPPLDGEYHNKEYRIFLNKEPVIINKKPLKWYDKILPEPKKQEYPMIKIDDYYNIDFNTFYPSMEKLLTNEKMPSNLLNGKFGNQVEYRKKENTIIGIPYDKLLITTGFYKIFDKGSPSNEELKEYRNNATKI